MAEVSPARHYGGFVIAGGTAFVTDVGVFQFLSIVLGINLLIARIFSITTAMVVSFLINRTVTFAVPGPPRIMEFFRFAAVAWVSSGLNYLIFATVLAVRPDTWPVAAITIATAFAMVASYAGMRLAVFRKG